jgi:hypothetical protein
MITHHMSTIGFGAREIPKELIREGIYKIESAFAKMDTIPLIEPSHMFVPGLYFREFQMEADTYLTGKLHAQDDGLIIARGVVTFLTENEKCTYEGPCMVTVKANTKPLLYAHTHVVFYSAHSNPDNTQDLEVIETRVVTPNCLGIQPQEVIR